MKPYQQFNTYKFRAKQSLRRKLNHFDFEESGTKNNKNLTDRKKATKKKRKLAKKMRQKNRRK